uniref:Uncharacterized protein LOC114334105 n=1 Tax=Diabrotica virgifera virgifera TaxID=50390 RepID=A0A6P7FYM3_DIAVI
MLDQEFPGERTLHLITSTEKNHSCDPIRFILFSIPAKPSSATTNRLRQPSPIDLPRRLQLTRATLSRPTFAWKRAAFSSSVRRQRALRCRRLPIPRRQRRRRRHRRPVRRGLLSREDCKRK